MTDFEKSLQELGDLEFNEKEEVKDFKKEDKDGMFQEALQGIKTNADIVLCIDLTGSMSPIINQIKTLSTKFYDKLIENMRTNCGRVINQLRVKVIGFRDFYCDGKYALEESEFFNLPEQTDEFHDFVEKLEAKGGGDEPENAMEALALAMKSDWVTTENYNTEKIRNVIILFTDASAHPLEKEAGHKPADYPKDMLGTYQELYDAWNNPQASCGGESKYNMDPRAERLIIFAPEDAYPWTDISDEFRNTAVVSIEAAAGGSEIAETTIISTISGSMK